MDEKLSPYIDSRLTPSKLRHMRISYTFVYSGQAQLFDCLPNTSCPKQCDRQRNVWLNVATRILTSTHAQNLLD